MPKSFYIGVNRDDPIRFYYYPVFGMLYRHRVELCLNECINSEKILEIGFGTGLSFLNLAGKFTEIHGIDLTANVNEISKAYEGIGITTYLKSGNILNLPYPDDTFNCVLLISILEHLKPSDLRIAFSEISRVLKPGGQVVYGVPVERPIMVSLFRLLGYDIKKFHLSSEIDVHEAARSILTETRVINMRSTPFGCWKIYEIGNFKKPDKFHLQPSI